MTEARDIQLGIARIRQHPVHWLRARAGQIPWLFIDSGDYLPIDANRFAFGRAWREGHFLTLAVKLGFVIGNFALVTSALVGVWLSRDRLASLAPLWSFPRFLVVAHLPMYVEPRYGPPLVPFVTLFAAKAASSVGTVSDHLR